MKTKVNEISIRYSGKNLIKDAPKISSSEDAAEILFSLWDNEQICVCESFKILLLNNANRVKGIFEVSKGGITATLVDLRIVFAVVLKSLTTSVILAHNHPSGVLKHSEADKSLTDKIVQAAKLFDIIILDHIILSPDGTFYSFAGEGRL